MNALDNAQVYRGNETTRLTNGEEYRGPIWIDGGELFILYQNKRVNVERGKHWDTWRETSTTTNAAV